MIELVWLLIGIVVVGAIWGGIGHWREKRTGTGAYEKYGPNPSPERIAEVDRPGHLYVAGVKSMARDLRSEAKQQWTESARLGDPRALTGLGVLAWQDGRKEEAKDHWARASTRGDVPAKVLLRLKRKSGADLTRDEFIRHFLRSEYNASPFTDQESLIVVAHAVGYFGYDQYAAVVEARRRRLFERLIY